MNKLQALSLTGTVLFLTILVLTSVYGWDDLSRATDQIRLVSDDNTKEDTLYTLWDGTDDSIVTTHGNMFYIKSTLEYTGKIMVFISAGDGESSTDTVDNDSLVLGAAIQYGANGGKFTYWFTKLDTLFWFPDTVAGGHSVVQDTTRSYWISSVPDSLSSLPLLANVIRPIYFWPDADWVQTYFNIAATSVKYEDNATNAFIKAIFVAQDTGR